MKGLARKMKAMFRDQRGLTAIELAVVVAILAVLAAIVAGNTAGMSTSARGSSMETDRSEVQKAVDSYRGQHPNSKYPTSDGNLANGTTDIVFDATYTTNDTPAVTKKFVPDFLQRPVKHASDLYATGAPSNTWVIDGLGQVKSLRTADQY